jgi:hypothetical protein
VLAVWDDRMGEQTEHNLTGRCRAGLALPQGVSSRVASMAHTKSKPMVGLVAVGLVHLAEHAYSAVCASAVCARIERVLTLLKGVVRWPCPPTVLALKGACSHASTA